MKDFSKEDLVTAFEEIDRVPLKLGTGGVA